MADHVTDAFAEASNVALESHTPDVGPAWAKYTVAGTTGMHVDSATDKATGDSSTSSSFYLSTYDPATDSYDIEVVINVSNFATAFSGIIFGADPSANTFYQVFFNSATNIRLQRIVSGATTVVKSVTGSWSTATDYKWRLSRRGNAFALYVDDVKVFDVKDSNITIPGRCGIRGRSTGTFDNFRLLDAEISPQNEVTTNGIWCWFTNPRALYDATNDCYYWGVVDTSGDIEVWKLDSNNVITGFDLIRAFEQDDHDHPGILILPSGKLVAFYSKHIDASSDTRYRITTSAGDVTAWGTEQTMTQAENPTYSHPFYMSGPDEVVVLYRGGLGNQYMNTADATISSWGTEQQIIDANGKRPYVIYEQNGPNRIDCLCTDQHPDLGASSVYHWYLEHDGSVWRRYKSDGTEITASMPWRVDLQATLIYDGSTTYGWIWDLRIDGSGNPHVLFTRFPSTTDHRLMYTKWTGSAWATPVEVAAQGTYLYLGQPHYSGGASFDGNDLSIVYLAAHGGTGYHEAQVWETADGGSTWSKTADITTGSSQTNARPVSPIGHDGRLACLWWAADYTAYDNYANASILRYENVTGAIGGAVDLSILDSSHTHVADTIAMTTDWLLSIADTAHSHSADGVTLTTDQVLAVTDAVQDHAADIVAMVLDTVLTTSDTAHEHPAESPALTTDSVLDPADSAHAHAADPVVLDTTGAANLAPADAIQDHAAEAPALTTDSLLELDDLAHVHAADQVALSTGDVADLGIADSVQAQAADTVDLTTEVWLAIADAVHSHLADAVGLTQADVLAILDAFHAQAGETVTLTVIESSGGSCPTVAQIADEIMARLLATTIPVDARKMNGYAITGAGTSANKWRGA